MNLVVLTGRLIKDCEVRKSEKNNSEYAVFNIAVNKNISKKKRETLLREGKYVADLFNIIIFGKYGTSISKYLKKGTYVTIEGVLNNYIKDNGTEKTIYNNIIANNVEFISSKNHDGDSDNYNNFDELIEKYEEIIY